jgi:PKD domain
MPTESTSRASRVKAAGVLAVLVLSGCGLDEVTVPDFTGPAELAISIRLTAVPDILPADGLSTSVVQATVRNENGQPLSGREIFFAVSDESGRFADIGTLEDSQGIVRPAGTGVIVRSGSNGVAQAIYRSPARTDATANQSVLIQARPVGDDFNGQIYRTVRVELRSTEPRLFPQNPDNKPPTCNFIVEFPDGAKPNVAILFQDTSSDVAPGTIVRYEWFFGDGTKVVYAPDTAHVFKQSGTYTVTHIVTDDDGAQDACSADIPIQ